MSRQQNLLSSNRSANLADDASSGAYRSSPSDMNRDSPDGVSSNSPDKVRPGSSGSPGSRGKLPAWLQRSELFLRVVVRLYVGVLVLVLPWTHLWDDNRLLNFYSWLAEVAANGVVRGIVSGLGLLNLWIAIADAIHYRES